MDNKDNLENILKQVQHVDNGINTMLVPILKDTIKDGNRHNTKLFIFAMCELLVLLITIIFSLILVYNQNQKYQDFLSQFDYESSDTVYQDLDSGEGDIINPTINNKNN